MVQLKTLFKVDIMKMRATQMVWLHIYIPISGLVFFLTYFLFSSGSDYDKVSFYLQTLCIVFPILISMITSLLAEQEYEAGQFMNILTISGIKPMALISKYVLVIILGSLSVLLSTIGFYSGFLFISSPNFPLNIYMVGAGILITSNLFIYTFHFFLSFRFSKSISISVGMIESLIAALFLTGLGDERWPYFPSSWSIRFISSLLIKYQNGSSYMDSSLNKGIFFSIVGTVFSFIAILLWFNRWEGKRIED